MSKEKWASLWREIAADNLSGASEIYAHVLQAFLQHLSGLDQTKVDLQNWPQCLREMLQSQPTMAPLYNLANQLALIFEREHLSDEERLAQARSFLQKERLQSSRTNAAIARHTFELLAEKPRVLTHSYSGTVAAALEYASAKGMNMVLYLSEARPVNEGRRMAERLARGGIPVHFFVDDARASFVNRVDLVLLGADRISEETFVNKIGSRSVALLAAAQKIPVAVLAARNKLWPAHLPFGEEPEHSGEEVWAGAPPEIKIHNSYFEETELLHMHRVIMEDGACSTAYVQNQLRGFIAAKFWMKNTEIVLPTPKHA